MERVRDAKESARFRRLGAELPGYITRSRCNEQIEPFFELAKFMCDASQQSRSGRAAPLLEQLTNKVTEFMERTYFRPARVPGAARSSKGIKDIVYLFRAYNDLHGYALEAAREEKEVIDDCVQKVDQLKRQAHPDRVGFKRCTWWSPEHALTGALVGRRLRK